MTSPQDFKVLPSDFPLLMPGDQARLEFPFFSASASSYLDTASSAQKPRQVLDAMMHFYSRAYANIHRGLYKESLEATEQYESTRRAVAQFLDCEFSEEILFTHGATEGFNLIANTFGRSLLKPGDEIILSVLEHHANIVPWQIMAQERGCSLRFVGITPDGDFDTAEFDAFISSKTKVVSVTHLSNAIGTRPPIEHIVRKAREVGAIVVLDGAQSVCHEAISVRELDVDFFVFSAHKLYGPSGIGIVYGRKRILETLPPFISGGDMIRSVSVEGSEFADVPQRFEAGTPHLAGVIGLGAAIDFVKRFVPEQLDAHERNLNAMLREGLEAFPAIRILSPAEAAHSLLTFHVDGLHPHDLCQFLAAKEVSVRGGHHCAQPLHKALKVPASTRISLGVYSTALDIERAVAAVGAALKYFLR